MGTGRSTKLSWLLCGVLVCSRENDVRLLPVAAACCRAAFCGLGFEKRSVANTALTTAKQRARRLLLDSAMIEHTTSSMGPRPPTGGMKLALEEAVTAHVEPGVLARVLPPFPLKGDRGERLGLGLNDSNQVTVVLPGSWAAAQGVLRRDKIVQANTEALVGGQHSYKR